MHQECILINDHCPENFPSIYSENFQKLVRATSYLYAKELTRSHLIFMDDKPDPSEWQVFHNILADFGTTSRLFINQKKPLLISNDPEAE